jgi:hypothetical protein
MKGIVPPSRCLRAMTEHIMTPRRAPRARSTCSAHAIPHGTFEPDPNVLADPPKPLVFPKAVPPIELDWPNVAPPPRVLDLPNAALEPPKPLVWPKLDVLPPKALEVDPPMPLALPNVAEEPKALLVLPKALDPPPSPLDCPNAGVVDPNNPLPPEL